MPRAPGAQVAPRPSVLRMLLRRELRLQIESYRFRVTAILILSLMTSAAWVHGERYRSELRTYREVMAAYTDQLESATVNDLADIYQPALKVPWQLAFLVDGEQSRSPNIYSETLSPWHDPVLGRADSVSQRLPLTDPLDWLFLVRVILSLAAFVFGYDAICGVTQHAGLKMTLSYPVGRSQVLIAKSIAMWIALAAPFLVAAAINLIILRVYMGSSFSFHSLAKIASVGVLGLWGIGLFVLIAVTVSALNREASRSLAVLSLVWVTCVVVIPSASGLLALTLRPVQKAFEIQQQLDEIVDIVEEEEGGAGSWRGPAGAVDGFEWEHAAKRTQNRRYEMQDEVRRNWIGHQFRQLELARDLAAISPMQLIQDLAERLSGSGAYRDQAFIEQVWAFHDRLEQYVMELDRADPDSPQIWFFNGYLSKAVVDAEAVPRFELQESTIWLGFERAGRRLIWLGLMTFILALTALFAFARYDVGQR